MDDIDLVFDLPSHEAAMVRAVLALLRCAPSGTDGIALTAEKIDGESCIDLMYTSGGAPVCGKSL